MALELVYQTRKVDHESKGELLNVANLTLVSAATETNQPVRFGEFDTEVTRIDSAIAAINGASNAYVDTVSTTLTDAISLATFADSTWTFEGSIGIKIGDVLVIQNATEQDSDRSWIMVSATGAESDFERLGSDVDAAITAAINTLKGDATTLTDLGLVEDGIQDLTTVVDGKATTKEYPISWGAPDVDGISTATIDTSADFGTKSLIVRVLKDLGDGFFEHISSNVLEISSNSTSVRLRTDSGAILASSLIIEVTGVPVV